MRNKVVLIKGFQNIAPRITGAPFERINADHVVIMAALRFPQYIPEELSSDFLIDFSMLFRNMDNLLESWKNNDQCHILAAEYANIAIERGGPEIKAVEGQSLNTQWVYDTIKNYHKHFGQTVIDCTVLNAWAKLDNEIIPIEEAIIRLCPHSSIS